MKNFIIFLYFVFLFKLTIAESLPNMPGLEGTPSVDDSMVQVPVDEEDASEAENIPIIDLPQDDQETTKLPASKVHQGKIVSGTLQNNVEKIVDPFPVVDSQEPVFDELKSEPEATQNSQNTADKNLEEIESSEQFPETPDLNFGGKKVVKKDTERALSTAEKEKQVDELLDSVIGEEEEEDGHCLIIS